MTRYPPIEPHASGMLDVGDGHSLYWEVSGNPAGKPAVVLHGGPGSGSSPGLRRLFDPQRYRIVAFDQRNSGRSTPWAGDPVVDLSTNTTQHLVDDIERLREHLEVDTWLVWGGSWGVTLGLVYAQQHPQRVTALVLAAVTNGDRSEIDWITQDIGKVFPREWEAFRDHLPPERRHGNLPAGYSQLLHDDNPAVRAAAAQAWCDWEDTHVSLAPDHEPDLSVAEPAEQLAIARIVTHYWSRGCFLRPQQILDDAHRLLGIPGFLVHGRFDVSGPLDTAWRLHRAWPGSTLTVIGDAGHSGASMVDALVSITDKLAVDETG